MNRHFAVVTRASSGIRFERAKPFTQNGYDLLIAADSGRIEEAARQLGDGQAQVQTVPVDLSDYDAVEKLYDAIQQTGRPVVAIAINAGVGVGGDFSHQTDLKAELKLIGLNVASPVHLTKADHQGHVGTRAGAHPVHVLHRGNNAGALRSCLWRFEGVSHVLRAGGPEGVEGQQHHDHPTHARSDGDELFPSAGMDDTKAGTSEKDNPAEVAREGFEALMAGKDHVVAG